MRVFFNLIFFVIIALCLAAPYATGFIVEKRYQEMIAKLNAGYDGDVIFEGKFERGYLSSNATTTLTHADEKVVLEHQVYHGPVVFKFSGWLKASNYKPQAIGLAVIETKILGPIVDRIALVYQDNPSYNITTIVEFNGDSHTKIINYPIKVTAQNRNIEWQGFTANFNIAYDTANIDSSFDAPFLRYIELVENNPHRTLELTNTKLDFKKTMSSSNETVNLAIGGVKFNEGASDKMITIDSLLLQTDITVLTKIMSLDWALSFNKLQMHNQEAGPFTMDVKMRNINTVALKKLIKMPMPLSATQPNLAVMQTHIPQDEFIIELLNSRPILDFNLSCIIPIGNINYLSHLEIGGPGVTSLESQKVWDTAIFSNNLKISKAIIHKVLLRYAQQQLEYNEKIYLLINKGSTAPNPYNMEDQQRKNMLANWVNNVMYILQQKKIIVDQDDFITMQLEFKNNELVVNGSKITQQDIDDIKPMLVMPILSPPAAVVPPATAPTPAKTMQQGTVIAPPAASTAPPSSRVDITAPLGAPAATSLEATTTPDN